MIHFCYLLLVFQKIVERKPQKNKMTRPNSLPLLPSCFCCCFCYLEVFVFDPKVAKTSRNPRNKKKQDWGGSSGREMGCAILFFVLGVAIGPQCREFCFLLLLFLIILVSPFFVGEVLLFGDVSGVVPWHSWFHWLWTVICAHWWSPVLFKKCFGNIRTPDNCLTSLYKVSQVSNHFKTWSHRPPCQAPGLGSFRANVIHFQVDVRQSLVDF